MRTKPNNIKTAIRKNIRHIRGEIPEAQRVIAHRKIFQFVQTQPLIKRAHNVCIYVSLPQEVDTKMMIEWLWENGKTVIVPRVQSRNLSLYQIKSWDDL